MRLLRHLSLSARILAGLALGIVTGVFFGEPVAVLQPVADIYIRLMQMTVLPYLVLALVIGFGQLDAEQARRLAWRGGALLLVTWALAVFVIAVMPMAFPVVQNATFFSSALVEPRQPFSIPDLYFTSNPFHALSNTIVPAVVLFSGAIGIGLIGLPQRARLLDPLRVINESVVRVTKFVIGLTPVGVFAIAAVTAGTISGETLQRLEVYFAAFTVAALVLAFWVLPVMVTALTPFSYREVVGVARGALLTAFVASNAFIVLPILIERSKDLMRARGLLNDETDSAAEILVPILFNFPNAGKLLTLLFVPFAAWLAGSPFGAADMATLAAVGIPAYFAKAQVALPFLLDVFHLPHDLFQLYIPTTILTGKLDSMLTAMNLLVFALLGAGAMGGFLEVKKRRVLRAGVTIAVSTAVIAGGLAFALRATIDTSYRWGGLLGQMHNHESGPAPIVHRTRPAPSTASGVGLAAARERGTLRIGYDPDNVPFSYTNADGQLVGFDVELALNLANSLGLRAEFIPIRWSDAGTMVASGEVDILPSVWVRPFWFNRLRLSTPYLTGTVGLAVLDSRRDEFASSDDLRHRRGLRIGVPLDTSQLSASMVRYFGSSDTTFVALETSAAFFRGERPDLDAFLMPAEGAAAATLLHPEYSVVVPQPNPVQLPYAFGMAHGAEDLADAVDEWVTFAASEGSIARAHRYWVLGQGAAPKTPRWSILRNVIGWPRASSPN